jgi:hypothetical protein
VKSQHIKKDKLRILHLINVVIWFGSTIISVGHIKDCYTRLFGRYLNYSIFEVVEFAYILGGLIVLNLLFKLVKIFSFLIYEAIWIIIIIVHLKIYFYCH